MKHTVEPIFIGKGIILIKGNKVIASNIGQGCHLVYDHCLYIRVLCSYGIISFTLTLGRKNSSGLSSWHNNWYNTIKHIL